MLQLFKSNSAFYTVLLIFSLSATLVTSSFLSTQHISGLSALRHFLLPLRSGEIYSRKCFIEEPTILSVETQHQAILGNGSSTYWTRYEVCCEGYERYEYDWNICVPSCGTKCENGLCVSPGECHCFPGFTKNDDGECVNTCPLGCLNGKCSFDGYCTCDDGYELDEHRKFCRPICQPPCSQQWHAMQQPQLYLNCTAPGRCECLKDYELMYGQCSPVCKPECQMGYCVSPNKCVCNSQSVLKNGVCQANCHLVCKNGFCKSRTQCQCYEGYYYDGHTTSCIPRCKNCFNGTCIEPNVCKCYKDYKLIEGKCEPHCPEGCIGGICKEPNICVCKHGLVDKIGICRGPTETRCLEFDGVTCTQWSNPSSWNY